MLIIIYFTAAFFLTYIGILLFRRWSLRRNLLDVPNERSSHSVPTPRGGGLIIVSVCLLLFLIYLLNAGGQIPWSYFAGAIIVALVSWIDDLYTISALWRFICHSFAAGLVIWFLGFWDSVYLPSWGEIVLGQLGAFLTFIWIVWLINAYNFMDGIDGIAGTQALTAGIGWLLIGFLGGSDILGIYGGIIAFSSLGFLLHNWQPAKIFMGDVGSAFLGYTFAVMPLLVFGETSATKNLLPVITVFLVWLFVFDSVFTLFKRLFKKEKIWQAHREHIYQRLVISGLSHQFVTVIYALLSAVVVFLITFWALSGAKVGNFVFLIIFLLSAGLLIFGFFRKKVDLSRSK